MGAYDIAGAHADLKGGARLRRDLLRRGRRGAPRRGAPPAAAHASPTLSTISPKAGLRRFLRGGQSPAPPPPGGGKKKRFSAGPENPPRGRYGAPVRPRRPAGLRRRAWCDRCRSGCRGLEGVTTCRRRAMGRGALAILGIAEHLAARAFGPDGTAWHHGLIEANEARLRAARPRRDPIPGVSTREPQEALATPELAAAAGAISMSRARPTRTRARRRTTVVDGRDRRGRPRRVLSSSRSIGNTARAASWRGPESRCRTAARRSRSTRARRTRSRRARSPSTRSIRRWRDSPTGGSCPYGCMGGDGPAAERRRRRCCATAPARPPPRRSMRHAGCSAAPGARVPRRSSSRAASTRA